MNGQLHNYFQGKLTTEEQTQLFQDIKKDAGLRKQFQQYQNLYVLLDLLPTQTDTEKGEKSYADFIEKNRKITQSIRLPKFFKYTAAMALLILSTWWITYSFISSSHKIESNTLYIPPGQRACLTLHDGTMVWLNAKSTLTYPARFSKNKREVTLVGEAFFDVSPNQSVPFIVTLNDITIKVHGTAFNVMNYPKAECIQASLLSGSIEVQNTSSKQKVTLRPNQEVLISNNIMEVSEIKQPAYFLWKDGIYSFEKERFADIIQKLELYYDIRIIVTEPEIYDFVYTGKFRQQDGIDEILRIIQKIHSFKIDRNREKNIIILSK